MFIGVHLCFCFTNMNFFWAFLIISILVPILAFFISGALAPISKGSEKLSTYESGIEPMGDT
uniref:NADH-ubiquinone oxidoreductase chain 3 n=1 Tax=Solanum lycopersicum TaxID=4081 RepID=A0A3Q7I001_SOLLC